VRNFKQLAARGDSRTAAEEREPEKVSSEAGERADVAMAGGLFAAAGQVPGE